MRERGFTLVELVVVLAIIGTLLTIGSIQFSSMQRKSDVEAQVRKIYSTLTEVRMEALYTKTPRSVTLNGNQLRIYASNVTSVAPISVAQLSFPMTTNASPAQVDFDSQGVMRSADCAICVQPDSTAENPGYMDSVVVSAVRTYMGKRQSGGACAPASIAQK